MRKKNLYKVACAIVRIKGMQKRAGTPPLSNSLVKPTPSLDAFNNGISTGNSAKNLMTGGNLSPSTLETGARNVSDAGTVVSNAGKFMGRIKPQWAKNVLGVASKYPILKLPGRLLSPLALALSATDIYRYNEANQELNKISQQERQRNGALQQQQFDNFQRQLMSENPNTNIPIDSLLLNRSQRSNMAYWPSAIDTLSGYNPMSYLYRGMTGDNRTLQDMYNRYYGSLAFEDAKPYEDSVRALGMEPTYTGDIETANPHAVNNSQQLPTRQQSLEWYNALPPEEQQKQTNMFSNSMGYNSDIAAGYHPVDAMNRNVMDVMSFPRPVPQLSMSPAMQQEMDWFNSLPPEEKQRITESYQRQEDLRMLPSIGPKQW